jgi:hypothetical protein
MDCKALTQYFAVIELKERCLPSRRLGLILGRPLLSIETEIFELHSTKSEHETGCLSSTRQAKIIKLHGLKYWEVWQVFRQTLGVKSKRSSSISVGICWTDVALDDRARHQSRGTAIDVYSDLDPWK